VCGCCTIYSIEFLIESLIEGLDGLLHISSLFLSRMEASSTSALHFHTLHSLRQRATPSTLPFRSLKHSDKGGIRECSGIDKGALRESFIALMVLVLTMLRIVDRIAAQTATGSLGLGFRV
jgi:hypothetical protein